MSGEKKNDKYLFQVLHQGLQACQPDVKKILHTSALTTKTGFNNNMALLLFICLIESILQILFSSICMSVKIYKTSTFTPCFINVELIRIMRQKLKKCFCTILNFNPKIKDPRSVGL